MSINSQKLSVKEKVGYSLGDLSANLVFQTLMMFLLVFYTDVFRISPKAAGTVILVGGVLGALFNFVMGAIADRTDTRWGKFRPWILWTAVPFGIMAWLTFSTPNIGETAKVAYAFVTYFFLVIFYSANNLPYAALSGVMTGDMVERTSLSSYRFVAVMVAQFTSQVLLLPLVFILGSGDEPLGFKRAIGIFAVVAVVFFVITFLSTRERIKPPTPEKTPLKQDVKDLSRNKPWIAIFALTVLIFISLAMRGGMLVYYFKEYLSELQLTQFLAKIGFTTESKWVEDVPTFAFSIFNGVGIVAMIIGIGFSKAFAKRFGKRDAFGGGLLLAAISIFLFRFLPPESVIMVLVMQIIYGLTYGVTIPLLWAMIADVADFSEWKNRRRATGIIFSAMIFGLKVGLGVGGSLGGYILALYGYNADLVQQSPQAINGIRMSVSVYPAIAFLVAFAILFFYEINKKVEYQMEADLSSRRAGQTGES
jgi:GPH family glycoside/pentoside/hexuronide:cation symporter